MFQLLFFATLFSKRGGIHVRMKHVILNTGNGNSGNYDLLINTSFGQMRVFVLSLLIFVVGETVSMTRGPFLRES